MDICAGKSSILAFPSSAFSAPRYGSAPLKQLDEVVDMISSARLPVLFLGMRASSPRVVEGVRQLLSKAAIPTVETFQAAGAVSQDLVSNFYGRVGLFRNQVGDKLLAQSDLIVCVGYDPVEYDDNLWIPDESRKIVHVDYTAADYGVHYHPVSELLGSTVENVQYLAEKIDRIDDASIKESTAALSSEYTSWQSRPEVKRTSGPVHPLQFVATLQGLVSKHTTVTVDVGTVYIYMMRYFYSYEPRRLLCSNGQQTLGVGLPWAIAASLAQNPPCSEKVVSLSGDGGFMFRSQEMSTAVQQGCNITHFIWNDRHFNIVEFQEVMKYGRSSGVKLGGVDFVKFAESFGARGFRVSDSSSLESVMAEALAFEGVSIVDIEIDYGRNLELAQQIIKDEID